MKKKGNILQITFYSTWFFTLLVQSWLVELQGDEAYYWRYSLQPAWGYFDHPPVSAMLVKIGYALFKNELGVRLLFICLITLTIWVLEKLIGPNDLKLYYAIVLSIAFLQLGMVFGGGMFAIPDFPLLFFTALFILLYRKYLNDDSWQLVIGLAIVSSLLLLTKYHGVLVIGFIVLSNLMLLKRPSFWVIVALTGVLLIPHIYWQFANDFPSIKYHLFERSSFPYSVSFTVNYLISQPFVLGPLIGWLLLYIGFTFRPADAFERGLKFVIVGTYLFFFVMTFKGKVEGNWTIITLVPLLHVGYQKIEKSDRLKKITFYCFAISLPLILMSRIMLSGYLFPPDFTAARSMGAKKTMQIMQQKFQDKPLAFMNSYQKASLYQFYTGVEAFSLNNVWGRKNQYSIWDTEAACQGKSVVVVMNYKSGDSDSIRISNEFFSYTIIHNFRSYSNVVINPALPSTIKAGRSDSLNILITIKFSNNNTRDLEANPSYPSYLVSTYFHNGVNVHEMQYPDFLLKNEMLTSNQEYRLTLTTPPKPGVYPMYLSLRAGWLPPAINSRAVTFIIE